MHLGRCVEIDLGYLGCYTDVLWIIDRRCSGQRSCDVRIPESALEATKPCLKELKNFLEVNYTCIPGKIFSQFPSLFKAENISHVSRSV